MSKPRKCIIMTLRVAMGFLMFYAGVTKVIDPTWTAAGYLNNAQTFSGFYQWLASPQLLPLINQINQWGLTFIGLFLIFGFFTRTAAWAGLILMILYYFPVLNFPYAGDHSYIVDDHIIYVLVFYVLIVFRAGNRWGIDALRLKN